MTRECRERSADGTLARDAAPRAGARATRKRTFVALLSLAFSFACGDEDTTITDNPGGTGGQVGNAGNGGSGTGGTDSAGSGGAAGDAGASGGGGGGNEPSFCAAPGDSVAWPSPESVEIPADASWKADLSLPNDEFFSFPEGDPRDQVRWVKFIVLAKDPGKIYFQNTATAPFHYEFASAVIPAFEGMTRAQFDAVTLENEGRQAILGAVLIPADSYDAREYGVQIVSQDDLPPELVDTVMGTVAAHVNAPAAPQAYYFPSGQSADCIESKREDFAARGISLASVDRWLTGDACYAPGWAVGRLVALPSADVDAAYLDGRLAPDDILLLTDTPPAELPFVSGILTLRPSTPNAHAAILARSYGVPFAYVRDADALAATQALAGKRVVLSTADAAGRDPYNLYFGDCDVRFIDVDALGAETLAELRALAAPPAVEVAAKRASGALTLPADGLVPADIDRVGGKAANFGLLRAAVPAQAPDPALALTFDMWDAFMDGPAPGGASGSLRDEIARRLAPFTWPADLRTLDAALEDIQDLIKDAPFPAPLRTSVIEALAGFDAETRIRFRSSTNVEDSETFTGAGLYDSATGCLADDLDADAAGPSRCNADELEERGVLRAIQRVYASFYFRNAYFERLRRGVNEATVGMGVLVHYSVPDEQELANGVATLQLSDGSSAADLVSQVGAVSVTNPDGSALPEQVHIESYDFDPENPYVATLETSSLVPLGGHVLEYDAEYRTLMTLLGQVADEYATVTGKTVPFGLDFEYKKVAPGTLSIRQVRPLPLPDDTRDVTPFLVNTPAKLCLYGSERADAFASHRLKARIALDGDDAWLSEQQLAQRLYTSARVEYVSGPAVATLEGDPVSFPGAQHGVENANSEATVHDAWTAADATWTLTTRLAGKAARNESPVRTPADFTFELATTSTTPLPFLDYSYNEETGVGGFVAATRTEEAVELWAYCPEDITVTADMPHIQASFSGPNGLQIQTSYYYPPPPRGATAGYTAPAFKWDQTTISGLTTTPIVLTGYFSQTYAPHHHNFSGEYIFDPRLEPGLSEATRAELETANVAYILVLDQDGTEDEFWVLGVDGQLRKL